MRALRVLGLAEGGENLVCEDGTSGELFTVPSDDRLLAATRGDLGRLGQLQIELEPQLRPREIQARIRAGSSIAQVAAAAQTSVGRIERYAYPVLLERSTMAEKARQSHPMIEGNPTRKTLEELVMSTLADRAQDASVTWDAYRDEDGWVVALRWHAGRSENRAEWEVHTGQRTNTLRPKNDAARDLIDPSPRQLRTIAEPTAADVARQITEAAQVAAVVEAEHAPNFLPNTQQSGAEQPLTTPAAAAAARHPAGSRRAVSDQFALVDQEHLVEQTLLDGRAGLQPAQRKAETARTGTDGSSARGHRKGNRPVMPGWEDVLLGGGQTPSL